MAGKPNDKMFKTMIEKHGSEEAAKAWYRSIGSRGGSRTLADGVIKGFAANRELASRVGKIGGRISKRTKSK